MIEKTNMNDPIFAILYNKRGRGGSRHWHAFKVCGDQLSQGDVEDLMLRMGYDTRHYFLQLESSFTIDEEYPHNYRLKSKVDGTNHLVFDELVWFEWVEGHRSFVFMDAEGN